LPPFVVVRILARDGQTLTARQRVTRVSGQGRGRAAVASGRLAEEGSVRLLISVSNEAEARAAIDGGADIIDAKEPARGPLGAVSTTTLREIVRAIDGRLPVSAALGDAADEKAVALAARRAAAERLAYVKIGFAGVSDASRVESLIAAAVHGAGMVSTSAGVIAVAYADASRQDVASLSPWWLVEAAERSGAVGVLLDTAVKSSVGVFEVMSLAHVAGWIRHAHEADLTVAVAGGLAGADLSILRALGADVAGVRGAACEGGDRLGEVSRANVAALARAAGRRRWPGREIAAHGGRTGSASDCGGTTVRAALP